MTKLLDRALAELQELPDVLQDEIAVRLLDRIDYEKRKLAFLAQRKTEIESDARPDVAHKDVEAWLRTWGTANEGDPPI